MLYLPESNYANMTVDVTIDGQAYTLGYTWNERDQGWRFSIALEGTVLATGIKMVANESLLSRLLLEDLEGDIQCLKFTSEDTPITFDNLGPDKAYRLVYLTEAELSEIYGD